MQLKKLNVGLAFITFASLIFIFSFPVFNLICEYFFLGFDKISIKNLIFFLENCAVFFVIVLCSLIFGFLLAWHDVFHDIKIKKIINCLIIGSLAFPSYINAFIYVKIFEKFGILHQIGLPKEFFFDFRTRIGYIVTMILSFYPYTYIIFKINLPKINNLILLGKTCHLKMRKIIVSIILPLYKPIIITSSIIIIMELLADFGVANELAINNFNMILYKKWFIQHNQNAAMKITMQMIMIIAIIFFFLVQKKQNVFKNYHNHSYKLPKLKRNILIIILTIIITSFSFILPLICMIYWATLSWNCTSIIAKLPSLTINTIIVAIFTTIILIILALIINYIYIFNKKNNLKKIIFHIPHLLYCIPGMIIVLSVMIINKKLNILINNQQFSHFLQNSFLLLIYIYCIRFLGISLNTLGNGNSICKNSFILSKIYNIKSLKKFFTIYIPLTKNNIILTFLFISSEIIKELPMTLIIRPFNFETLATKVNNLVSEERYNEASLPSLIIVILEIILILILIRRKKGEVADNYLNN